MTNSRSTSKQEKFGFRTGLEYSNQAIPTETAESNDTAPSRPLFELELRAPIIPTNTSARDAIYPFSNDGNAADYEALTARALTPEYQHATNRVAVVCGESSLSASIMFMPEDTIVIVDIDAAMCKFMQRYINALRNSDTPADMLDRLAISADDESFGEVALRRLDSQMYEWDTSVGAHAMSSEDMFRRASEIARKKAIIVWHADLTNAKAMNSLGGELKKLDAHVTFANITNVPAMYTGSYDKSLKTQELGYSLSYLPMTPNAPIMVSGTTRKDQSDCIVEPLGPFFGIGNLLAAGGEISAINPGALVERKYCEDYFANANPQVTIVLGEYVIGLVRS